jgi:hypothetical protein
MSVRVHVLYLSGIPVVVSVRVDVVYVSGLSVFDVGACRCSMC